MVKQSLQDKLTQRRKDIKDRSAGGSVVFIKEGTLRIRVLPTPEDGDWAVETQSFYLGGDIKGVFSRETIDADCPIMDEYRSLKDSDKDGDKDIAKAMTPRTKYLVAAIVYEDDRGKKINEKDSKKLVQIPTGIYTQMIDLFLDPDLGDFTDPEEGYDLKIKRVGKGKQDTEYTLMAVKPKPIATEYRAEVDPMARFKETVLLSYEDCEDKLAQYLVDKQSDGEDDERPPKEEKPAKEKRSRRRRKK